MRLLLFFSSGLGRVFLNCPRDSECLSSFMCDSRSLKDSSTSSHTKQYVLSFFLNFSYKCSWWLLFQKRWSSLSKSARTGVPSG